MTVRIYDGPVIYSYGGIDYTVYFKDFTIYFDIWPGGMEISDANGGLTIDGQYIPVDKSLADVIF